jgi:hypothetical protein
MEEIEVPVWVRCGGMMLRREYLSVTHPDSTYNYIKNILGLSPEDYGYYSYTLTEEQSELLSSITLEALYDELERRERYEAF